MKKSKILCISVLLLGLVAGPAMAQVPISYCKDILESGNPPAQGTCDIINTPCTSDLDCAGGALACIKTTLKTWDETWDLQIGETMDMDIWLNDAPESILTAGCFIEYDPALISLTNLVPNDSNSGGPWDGGGTQNFAPQPGQWLMALVQFGCVEPDGDGDIFLGRATFESLAGGQVDITVSPIPDFDTVVGCGGTNYDGDIVPNTVVVNPGPGCVCEIDADCDDGVFCNGAETCDCECFPGTPPTCDDGVSCTDDTCDAGLDACVNTPNDDYCDDGIFCNGVETCDAVSDCLQGTPPVCDDGVDCTVDSCNEGSDACESTPDDGACDDGNQCTTNSCDPASGCQAVQLQCPEGQICNQETGQCEDIPCEIPEDCDDGLYCNGMETCDTGTGSCQPGTPPTCDDGVRCTMDECNEASDTCDNTPVDERCIDDDPCTIGTCDPEFDCVSTPVVCSPGEICVDGQCVPTGCEDDSWCDDGLYCNGMETCDTGTGECFPGNPPNCDDDVDCTMDRCNEESDLCENIPNNDLCDDGNVCNGMETCDLEDGCQAGDPLNCDDGVYCTDDTCDEVAGCRNTPDDENCQDDGMYCNGEELCDPVNDCYSTGDPCPSGTECNEETDSCDSVGGLMVYVDIDPYECPNSLNLESTGKVRISIMGTNKLDVSTIDPESIMLQREGVEGAVYPVRTDIMERGNPYDGKLCSCPDCGKDGDYTDSSGDVKDKDGCKFDGIMDLSGYFRISEMVEALDLAEVAGQRVPLTITGMLVDGTPISGKDCVDVLTQCKGDFDCDGDVDGGDADKMKKKFGWDQNDGSCKEKGTCEGDFDKDGDIDSTDINAFKTVFGSGPKKGSPCGYEECKGDFDCDADVDGQDAKKFSTDFGRSPYNDPCEEGGDKACFGDFDGDKDCDGKDAAGFKKDFGRSPLRKPCKGCVVQ